MLVQRIKFDERDKIFFVGDVHGRYTLLINQLKQVGFSPENGDKLVAVGDLIDHGNENDECLKLLDEPWLMVVEGNHENLMKKATKNLTEKNFNIVSSYLIDQNGLQKIYDLKNKKVSKQSRKASEQVESEIREMLTYDELMWIANGGAWFYDVFDQKGFEFRHRQAKALHDADLPLALEVSHPSGLVGVVHAGLKSNDWMHVESIAKYRPSQLMWMRDHINAFESDLKSAYEAGFVKGLDALVVGHTITKNGLPLVLANTIYIDVGAKINKPPFVIELAGVLGLVKMAKCDEVDV